MLGAAASPAIPALSNALHDPQTFRPAVYALAHIGPAATEALSMALTNQDAQLRRFTLNCFASPDADGDTGFLLILSVRTNSDPSLRALATRCLAIGDIKAIPILIDALSDRAISVRVAAIGALGSLEGKAKSAVPALLETYRNDSEASICRAAASAIKRIDPESAERAGIKEPILPNPGRPKAAPTHTMPKSRN
jgi:HEAT repeat protein